MQNIKGIICDLDGTIYSNDELQKEFEEYFISFISIKKKIDMGEAKQLFESKYNELYSLFRVKPSELSVLTSMNLNFYEWIEYSNNTVFPEKYLREDTEFISILKKLKSKLWFDVATNTSNLLTVKILKCIGIIDLVERLWCPSVEIDASIGGGKPSMELYKFIADYHDTPPQNIVTIGDRWHIDLYGTDTIGMKGYLVSGPDDTKSFLMSFIK